MSAIKSAYKNILLCMRQVNKPGMDKKQEHRTQSRAHRELATGNWEQSTQQRGSLLMVCANNGGAFSGGADE